jgi:hypothetical protein
LLLAVCRWLWRRLLPTKREDLERTCSVAFCLLKKRPLLKVSFRPKKSGSKNIDKRLDEFDSALLPGRVARRGGPPGEASRVVRGWRGLGPPACFSCSAPGPRDRTCSYHDPAWSLSLCPGSVPTLPRPVLGPQARLCVRSEAPVPPPTPGTHTDFCMLSGRTAEWDRCGPGGRWTASLGAGTAGDTDWPRRRPRRSRGQGAVEPRRRRVWRLRERARRRRRRSRAPSLTNSDARGGMEGGGGMAVRALYHVARPVAC